jgi:hypothetical protein
MPTKKPRGWYVHYKRLLIKIKAIEYSGGECKLCGYKKCPAALEFHHRDPTLKEFSWDRLRGQSWASIVKELDKCDLLCSNCHRETHWIESKLYDATQYQKIQDSLRLGIRVCICGAEFKQVRRTQKYCSNICIPRKTHIDWPTNLPELVKETSMAAVGRLLGVSGKSVKYRLENHHEIMD